MTRYLVVRSALSQHVDSMRRGESVATALVRVAADQDLTPGGAVACQVVEGADDEGDACQIAETVDEWTSETVSGLGLFVRQMFGVEAAL